MRITTIALTFAIALIVASSATGQVYIQEYMNDPLDLSAGLTPDPNGDGVTDSSNDEFIEIVNAGMTTVDISDWEIEDDEDVRHVFASGTMLDPGAAIVVFGGASDGLAAFNALGGATGVIASSGALGLNNGGDSIDLLDDAGLTVDDYTYTGGTLDDGDGFSVTRDPEGPGSPFLPHPPGAPVAPLHSAGFRNDGVTPYLPATLPAPAYPGNGTDCVIQFEVAGAPSVSFEGIHTAVAGDFLRITFLSPAGTLNGGGFVAVVSLFATGTTLTPIDVPPNPAGTGFWPPLATAFAFIDGGGNFAPLLVPGGFVYATRVGPALAGLGMSAMFQAVPFDPSSPFQLGLTQAHELVIL